MLRCVRGLRDPVDLDAAAVPLAAAAILIIVSAPVDGLHPGRRRVVHTGVELAIVSTLALLESALEAEVGTSVTVRIGKHRVLRACTIWIGAGTDEPDAERLERGRAIDPISVVIQEARVVMDVPASLSRWVSSWSGL